MPTDNFIALNGGAGVSLACNTSSSTRTALPSAAAGTVANAVRVTNTGVNYAFLVLGGSTVSADTSGTAIAPGGQATIEFQYAGSSAAPTYAAGISTGGNTTLQITLGILT